MFKVFCIITTKLDKKSRPYLMKCIESLKNQDSSKVNFEVVIVTNSLAKNHKFENIISVYEGGFSEMQNAAIKFIFNNKTYNSHTDYILFLNDDVKLETNFFQQLSLSYQDADVIIPLILSYDGTFIDSFGIEYFLSGYAKNNSNIAQRSSLGTGACLLVKIKALNELFNNYGFYFNQIYYFYIEDVDFSIRLSHLDLHILQNKKLIAYHYGSLSTGKRSRFSMYHTYRNILWLMLITWSKKLFFRNAKHIVAVQTWTFFYTLISGNPLMYLKIMYDSLIHARLIFNYRKIYRKNMPNMTDEVFSNKTFRLKNGYDIKL